MNKTKIVFFSAGAMIILLFMNGCAKKNLICFKAENTIMIDGFSDEWEKYQLSFSENDNFAYGACSDTGFMYFIIKMTDQQLAMRIMRHGVTFFVNEKGGKNKKIGFNFKNEHSFTDFGGKPDFGGMPDFRMRPDKFAVTDFAQRGNFKSVLMFNGIPKLSYSSFDMNSPQGAFSSEKGFTAFEFKIPIKMVDNKCGYELTKSKKPIIGVKAGGFDFGAMGGGMPPPGSMGGRGGMGGGGGGMKGRSMTPQFDKEIELWCRLEFEE